MAFPIKVCVVCSEEFELKPGKPGFANRCPECSEPERVDSITKQSVDADERKSMMEANKRGDRRCATFSTARMVNRLPNCWYFCQSRTLPPRVYKNN